MKTIKQIADEIGVSKTAVRKKMTDEVKTKFSQTVSGKIYIDENGERIIRSSFESKFSQTANRKPEEMFSQTVSGHVFSDNKLYEILKEELKEKNKQIEKLQDELEKERQYSRDQFEKIAILADQAQRLHLAEIAQSDTSIEEVENVEEKPSLWKRIFKNKS